MSDLASFFTAWAWKREHLSDRDRFQKPFKYNMEGSTAGPQLVIKQARFKATGFASTVWDSSIVACKYLETQPDAVRGKRCLDLSAGCGLVACVLSHLGAAEVVATDLAGNLGLLTDNCKANAPGRISVQEHCWGQATERLLPRFDLIVACDVMYIAEAIPALASTLAAACAPGGTVLVAHGRNRGGEQMFMQQVQDSFTVQEVGIEQLHPVYRCSDVSVYRLTRITGSTDAGGAGAGGTGAGSMGEGCTGCSTDAGETGAGSTNAGSTGAAAACHGAKREGQQGGKRRKQSQQLQTLGQGAGIEPTAEAGPCLGAEAKGGPRRVGGGSDRISQDKQKRQPLEQGAGPAAEAEAAAEGSGRGRGRGRGRDEGEGQQRQAEQAAAAVGGF